MVSYPNLASEIAKRGIKKKDIALCIGVCVKSWNNRFNGRIPFTWPEVVTIRNRFFPGVDLEYLFQRSDSPGK